jgi:hypothetical protein
MDRTWRIPGKSLDEARLREAGTQIAAGYAGVGVEVEREDPEFITFFFTVPRKEEEETIEVEITVYHMGRDGLVLSLEADAADNDAAWDDACQLCEDLADHLDGAPLEV